MADPEYYEKRKQAIRRGLQNGGPAGGKAAEIAFNEQHRPQKKTYKCLICGKEIKSKNILDFNVHASTEHRECFYDEKGNRIHDKRLRDYVEVIRFGIIRHTATKNLNEELIKEWRKHRDSNMKQTLARVINIDELDEEKHKEILDEEEARIKEALEYGLDIGTIIRYIIPVTLTKYEGEFYFKAEDGELFRVNRYL